MLTLFLTIFNGHIIKQLCQFSKSFYQNLGQWTLKETFEKGKQTVKKKTGVGNKKKRKKLKETARCIQPGKLERWRHH